MLLYITKQLQNIIKISYRVDKKTRIYYPEPSKSNNLFTDPRNDEIEIYTPEDIPRNSYEKYYDENTQISIIIFSVGEKMFIYPEMAFIYPEFYISSETQFKKAGLKERKMNTPFSCGAIPANSEWIKDYRDLKTRTDYFRNSFNDDFDDEEIDY